MRMALVGVTWESSLLLKTWRIVLWIVVRWSFVRLSGVVISEGEEPFELKRSWIWVICSGGKSPERGERSRVSASACS